MKADLHYRVIVNPYLVTSHSFFELQDDNFSMPEKRRPAEHIDALVMNFHQSYSDDLISIKNVWTSNGNYKIALRYQNLSSSHVEVLAGESDWNENNTNHSKEEIHFLIYNTAGDGIAKRN